MAAFPLAEVFSCCPVLPQDAPVVTKAVVHPITTDIPILPAVFACFAFGQSMTQAALQEDKQQNCDHLYRNYRF